MALNSNRSYLLGARLSGLLVNVGSQCLRQIFEEGVMKIYSHPLEAGVLNLTSFFTKEAIKKMITPYYKGKGKPHLIREEQWQLLYPDSGEVSTQTFDLTLLTLLIKILKLTEPPSYDWPSDPPESNCSVAANISRLRIMRNQHYGHICTTGYINNQYHTTFNKLKNILLQLGADGKAITEWKNKFSVQDEQCNNDMKDINEQLINLIRTDLCDIQTLQKNLIEIVETLTSGNVTQFQSLATAMDELRSSPDKVLETFNIIQEALKDGFETISMQFVDLVKGDESMKSILFEIKRELHKNSKVQQEIAKSLNEVIEGQQKDREKLDKLVKEFVIDPNIRDRNEASVPGLLFDHNDWRKIKDPFRILIITSVSQLTANDVSFRKLGEAVGLCPWQLVIDLDHRSQSSDGLFDLINETLRKHTVTQVETYKAAQYIKENDKEAVVKGEKVLWILANGSETLDCEPCINCFAKSTSKIELVFNEIVSKFALKRPLLCVAVLLTNVEKELKAVKDIGSMLKRFYECHDEKIDITASKFCVFANHENLNSSSIEKIPKSSEYMEWKRYSDSLTLFSDFFHFCFGRQSDVIYSIPSASESIGLSEEDYVQLQTVMELYHKDIGKMNLKDISDIDYETKVTEIKYRYLKGNPITPEALNLQENGVTMFVVRKEMHNIKLKVQEELQRRQKLSTTNRSRKGICLIEHETSGGGTTCGRYLLFSLRTEFPCIEIKQFGSQLLDWLKVIYSKAKIPLLLLVDNLDCQTSEIIALERFLENNQVKTLLVHLKRKITGQLPTASSDSERPIRPLSGVDFEEILLPLTVLDFEKRTIDMEFHLNSQVTETSDKFAFKKLYEANEKKAQAFKLKIFMFGLYKFLGEYEKLDIIIKNCITAAQEPQLSLMRAILFMWKYAHTGIKLEVARKWLRNKDEDPEKALGSIADFLVYDSNTRLLKTANDCIVKPFLDNCGPSDNGVQLDLFLNDITNFSKDDSDEKSNSFDLVCSLFIKGRKIYEHWWTEFIEDLEKSHDKHFISHVTDTFLHIFDGVATQCPHLRTFYARYLMHRINNYENAIVQIRIALGVSGSEGISSTSVTDHVLLSAYGYLHRNMMKHKMKDYIDKMKKNRQKAQLVDIFHFASEAVEAFAKAQISSKTSLYDMNEMFSGVFFYIEANTRYLLLSHLFKYICSENHDFFAKFIAENHHPLVKESLPRALRVLQDLEYSIVIGRVELDADTSQNVTRTKFDLLQLLTDEKLPIKQQLSKISDKLPCDFGYFVLKHSSRTSSPGQWKGLSLEDLKFIVEKISTRIQNPEVMLRANYRDVIRAMISLRQKNAKEDLLKYNLNWACECAVEWAKHHLKDFEAQFMLGFLRLLEAVSGDDFQALTVAKKCLETCKKLCKENPSMPAYCHFWYIIGIGEGLEKAIPYDKAIAKPDLMEFIGRKIDDNCITVRLGKTGNAFKVKILKGDKTGTDEESWSVIQNQRLVTFNLAIALDRISAINVSIYKPNESSSLGSD